jgi:DNA-binding transcriptional LysR family regulator
MHVGTVDLNLLVALRALLTERNVTRAARRVGLSQSAMSHALARLRETFSDPLFLRSREGLIPTERALRLEPALNDALRRLDEEVLADRPFDPRTSDRHFRIACHDLEQLALLPRLVPQVTREAPRVKLEFNVPDERLPWRALQDGRLDFALAVRVEDRPGLYAEELFDEDFVVVVRKSDPRFRKGVDLAAFVAAHHLLVTPFGGLTGIVDDALRERGLARSVRLGCTQFSLAPWILLESDMILTLPRTAATLFARALPLALHEPPLPLPRFSVHAIWAERSQSDPAHRWLRQAFRECFKDKRRASTPGPSGKRR